MATVSNEPAVRTRHWRSTAATRKQILDAAAEVFAEMGFRDANVSEVVSRSGSSVGSIYHHFGGKTELFLAIWEDLQDALLADAARGVAEAREAGKTDALEMFQYGSRAFLESIWRRRNTAKIFFVGDVPPEFANTRRERSQEWLRRNSTLLRVGKAPRDRMMVGVFTSVISEASREVVRCRTRRDVAAIIDAALEILARLDPRE